MLDKATAWLINHPANLLNGFQDVFALAIRLYVGWQFFKAGQLKINSWSNTLQQFQFDFQVPLLPPYLAAVLGTFGELFFPLLLWVGLTTRLASIGLQFVNVVAVISVLYLFPNGLSDPAFGDHYLWGLMMLGLTFYGPGRLSIDFLLIRRRQRVF
ncbi:DoxX family protein [Candidatus Rariloculus sp.]|uniref:DoxX family protein n=1 Tax=Candidatus Rariloculus sp. TaxID=3101265 RepID=UPI003D0D932B